MLDLSPVSFSTSSLSSFATSLAAIALDERGNDSASMFPITELARCGGVSVA